MPAPAPNMRYFEVLVTDKETGRIIDSNRYPTRMRATAALETMRAVYPDPKFNIQCWSCEPRIWVLLANHHPYHPNEDRPCP